MSDRIYSPDRWEIVQINNNGKIFYKILGDWSGSYLEGRSWRMSSPVVGVEEVDDNIVIFKNYSGSTYNCYKRMKSLGVMTSDIFANLEKQAEEAENTTVSLISIENLVKGLEENPLD